MTRSVQIRRLTTAEEFVEHLAATGVELPFAADPDPSVLSQPYSFGRFEVPNRFAVLPMEGWDGTAGGRPTELTERRWRRFGESGAGLVWGGEAVAVREDGRANPRQLVASRDRMPGLASLREELAGAHASRYGPGSRQVVGLQLAHSGRWSRPSGDPAPRTAHLNPVLDARTGAGPASVMSDGELDDLVDAYVTAAEAARDAGFDFVDVKCCHGYLMHELLSGVDRPGRYGGDLNGRALFLRTVVAGIRAGVRGIEVGVRLSLYDFAPFASGEDGTGVPESGRGAAGTERLDFAFGCDGTGVGVDLTETHALLDMLEKGGVVAVCASAGSPYYNPHIQRPAYFPPSDGYGPPEDPLVGVARMVQAAADVKARHPGLVVVGSGFTYLQDWLAHVASATVSRGWVDAVGLGRMMLSYHDFADDVLQGRGLDRRRVCRTFSDCTTAPRNGLVSGCYPLDHFYRERPERAELARVKRDGR